MSDFMSKIPSLKELTSMTGKLVNGIKTSVGEIVEEYKKNHPPAPEKPTSEAAQPMPKETKPATDKVEVEKKPEEKPPEAAQAEEKKDEEKKAE